LNSTTWPAGSTESILKTAFVGDDKNDVHPAQTVGVPVPFNAQEELCAVVTEAIAQAAARRISRRQPNVAGRRA
jgi:phosphoserine phosphatase